MEWKYVKLLNDDKSIADIEQKYNVKIPEYLKDIIMRYNGGRALKNIFDTKNSKEKVFKNLNIFVKI